MDVCPPPPCGVQAGAPDRTGLARRSWTCAPPLWYVGCLPDRTGLARRSWTCAPPLPPVVCRLVLLIGQDWPGGHGRVPPPSPVVCRLVLLIADECHKAVGKTGVPELMQHLHKSKCKCRVVGLSATPGSDLDAVKVRASMLAFVKVSSLLDHVLIPPCLAPCLPPCLPFRLPFRLPPPACLSSGPLPACPPCYCLLLPPPSLLPVPPAPPPLPAESDHQPGLQPAAVPQRCRP